MNSFKLAYLHLIRRKTTSLLALVAIAISVGSAGILLRLNILAESRFASIARGGQVIIGAKSGGLDILLGALNSEGAYPGFLPLKLYETLKADTAVHFEDGATARPSAIESIIPFLYFAKYEDLRVVATNESFIQRPQGEALSFAQGSWAAQSSEVVLGSWAAAKYGLKIGDSLDAKSWLGEKIFASQNISLKVVGILNPTHSSWDRNLFTDLSTAQSLLSQVNLSGSSVWGQGVLNYFLIYLKPGASPSALESLINQRTVGQLVEVSSEKEKLENLVGRGRDLALFVTGLILVLGGFAVAAMLITRFEAMSTQLAVLRALGYKKSAISGWLLWEGILLGVSAVLLGLVIDGVFFPLVRARLGDSLPSSEILSSPLWWSYPVWITALVATLVSVILPLSQAYRQNTHNLLRS